ncbi:MAG: hypothetical protein ACYTFA_05405 [Planctomycetota bacterium]
MRKTKTGPALFDVLSRERDETSDTLEVPRWWTPGHGEAQPRPVRMVDRGHAAGNGDRRVEPPGDTGEILPFFELVGRRIRVSFTSAAAAAVVFLAMVIVLAGFELGRRSGDGTGFRRGYEAGRASYAAEAMDEIELARTQPPATHLVRSLLTEPGSASEQAGASVGARRAEANETEWIRDYTYIVAQEFAADRTEDAQRAQAFLAEHRIPTALVRLPNGAIQLITMQGYNQRDPTQKQLAERLLEKEHGIGSKYFAAGGGYRLKGYFRTLKSDTW